MNNPLRYIGQCLQCCLYQNPLTSEYHGKQQTIILENISDYNTKNIYTNKKAIEHLKSCTDDDYDNSINLQDGFNNKNNWYNKNINTASLSKIIYFPSLDLRKFEKYNRQSNTLYLTRGLEALEKLKEERNKPQKVNVSNKRKQKMKEAEKQKKERHQTIDWNIHVDGVAGLYCMASNMSSDFATQVPPDPFHALYNNSKRTFRLMKDKLVLNSNTVKFLFENGMFPELWWSEREALNAQYIKNFQEKSAEELERKEKKLNKKKTKKKKKEDYYESFKQNEEKKDDSGSSSDSEIDSSSSENEQIQIPTNKNEIEYNNMTDKSKGIHPPWRIMGQTQSFVQYCISCVLYPVGYSQMNMGSTKLFSQMGHIKGVTMIDITKCLMDLILFAILIKNENYPEGYITYFSLLSSIYSKLLAPIVHNDDIDSLYMKTVEFVTIQNGCFPPTESYFTYHQLVDLPHVIKHFGPLRNWWTLPGERALQTVKSFITDGGRSYYQPVFRKCTSGMIQALTEAYKDENFYFDNKYKYFTLKKQNTTDNDNFNIDNNVGTKYKLFYSDFKSKLYNQDKDNRRDSKYFGTSYEISKLLIFMAQEVIRFCNNDINEAIIQSTVYRLFYSSQMYVNDRIIITNVEDETETNNVDFSNINDVRSNVFYEFIRDLSIQKRNNLKENNIDKFKLTPYFQINNIKEYLDEKNIIEEDFENCNHLWFSLICKDKLIKKVYNNATIWGTVFTARGHHCKETNYPKNVTPYGRQNKIHHPTNPNNAFMHRYIFIKESLSSWCKFHLHKYNLHNKFFQHIANKDTCTISNGFGQINCFFRLTGLTFDKLLNDMPIASITTRTPSTIDDKIKKIHKLNSECNIYEMQFNNDNFDANILFVATYNIYSTPILSVPFIKYQLDKVINNKIEKIIYTIPIMKTASRNDSTTSKELVSKLTIIEEANREEKAKRVNDYGFLILSTLKRERECIHENKLVYSSIHPYFNKEHNFYETINDVD
jgi:hypothetical protein